MLLYGFLQWFLWGVSKEHRHITNEDYYLVWRFWPGYDTLCAGFFSDYPELADVAVDRGAKND